MLKSVFNRINNFTNANSLNAIPLSCISMSYQECKTRTNETRHIKWHETCQCECKFGTNICNNKQPWNKDKWRCECKELIDKGVCDKGFIWNPSNCECECDKACDADEYLDYENCNCRKKLVAPLTEDCTETVKEVNLVKITLAKNENSSCTVYIVLSSIFLTINVGIVTYYVYSQCYTKKILHMLILILAPRQRFTKYINGKSQTY